MTVDPGAAGQPGAPRVAVTVGPSPRLRSGREEPPLAVRLIGACGSRSHADHLSVFAWMTRRRVAPTNKQPAASSTTAYRSPGFPRLAPFADPGRTWIRAASAVTAVSVLRRLPGASTRARAPGDGMAGRNRPGFCLTPDSSFLCRGEGFSWQRHLRDFAGTIDRGRWPRTPG